MARAFFRKPKSDVEDDEGADDGRRELHFRKNQYGPLGHTISLQWHNGLWLPPTPDSADAKRNADDLFLQLLTRFADQGRRVSPNKGPTYAPAQFAELPERRQPRCPEGPSRGDGAAAGGEADRRPYGGATITPAIVSRPSGEAAMTPHLTPCPNCPSNGFQPLPTGCVPTPPYPPPGGKAHRGVGRPTPGDLPPAAGEKDARERWATGGATTAQRWAGMSNHAASRGSGAGRIE